MWCLYNQPICACVNNRALKTPRKLLNTYQTSGIQMFRCFTYFLIACVLLIVFYGYIFLAFAEGITVETAQCTKSLLHEAHF